ncbi:ABC transporter ATP-binding protein [Pseudomonas entomophila]|uniref:energy-coupling factor ABC transporter ATP-binding protein n=1 Tax=Pseudomonas entomophila TaxID=312306 RepID=UPI0023D83158|nr:ABC transporter ATP-binding protein [Pseudomonas entomophila]MDF0731397.1 ABC transporter ATP-binding protein [Pseudomonas entomophila]
MLEVHDLHFAHPGRAPLFEGLGFTVRPGRVLALIGRNGAGKSTLVRVLNGLGSASRGRVLLDGQDITGERPDRLADRIGTLFQVPEQQIFHASVAREVGFGLPRDAVEPRVEDALRRSGLQAQREAHPLDLDHAARRMVAMASLLARQPRVLLLDEPQRGLDARATARMSQLIEDERARGAMQVLICHDMEFVARHADEVLALGAAGPTWAPATQFFADAGQVAAAGAQLPLAMALSQRLAMPPTLRLERLLAGRCVSG